MKELVYRKVSRSGYAKESDKEKVIKGHRADVFFTLTNGKKVAVEVQHSLITVKEIVRRTRELNDAGLYVLWILHAKGWCTAEPRSMHHEKKQKIAPAEFFLHFLYGGRVYYLFFSPDETKISSPIALHFSYSKKTPKGRFPNDYGYYYLRDCHPTAIPSWNLLCTEFKQGNTTYKIARFYDTHIKNQLKEKIMAYIHHLGFNKDQRAQKKITKTITKKTLNHFKKKYGVPLIVDCISSLQSQLFLHPKRIDTLRKKTFAPIEKKVKRKKNTR